MDSVNQRIWEKLAEENPLEAVMTRGGSPWEEEEFYATGESDPAVQILTSSLPPSSTVLDYGCGVGRLTIPLMKYFRFTIGFDHSSSMIHKAWIRMKKTFKPGGDFPQISLACNTSPLDSEKSGVRDLGGILCNLVIQHMPHTEGYSTISKFVSILAPRGVMALSMAYKLPNQNEEVLVPAPLGYGMYFYSRKVVEAYLLSYGSLNTVVDRSDTGTFQNVLYKFIKKG